VEGVGLNLFWWWVGRQKEGEWMCVGKKKKRTGKWNGEQCTVLVADKDRFILKRLVFVLAARLCACGNGHARKIGNQHHEGRVALWMRSYL
jgi:hypothetical protein